MEHGEETPLGLYIHIPFCVRKCDYCDFLSFPVGAECRGAQKEQEAAYITALIRELRTHTNKRVSTIYIGGGTPSVLEMRELERLLDAVQRIFSPQPETEYSIEVNPGTIDCEKADILKQYGVNRISMGLQSASDQELAALGRIHTAADFERSYALLRERGFENINIDIISGIPSSTLDDWERTLDYVLEKQPEHLSAYSLIVEEGTPFYERYGTADGGALPDEETERAMEHLTRVRCAKSGYLHYEISNYAREGFACRHNIGYWRCMPYIGAGLGASGYENGERYRNTVDLDAYLGGAEIKAERDLPDRKAQVQEFLFLGLRMREGISHAAFRHRFGLDFDDIFHRETETLTQAGLLESARGRTRLTERGCDLENYVNGVLYQRADAYFEGGA